MQSDYSERVKKSSVQQRFRAIFQLRKSVVEANWNGLRATGRERKDAESRSKGWKLEDESEESFEENLTQMREELVERSVSIRIKQSSNLICAIKSWIWEKKGERT